MPERDSQVSSYPTLESILGAVADWVNRYHRATGARRDFGECDADEVMRIAHDLGIPASDLETLARKGEGGAALLTKMLAALNIDPQQIARSNPAVMRDLQRLCVTCAHRKQCSHELAAGTAAEHFHQFCPNAYTLDALFEQTERARH